MDHEQADIVNRLRAIENAALRVASSRRDGIVTDRGVLDRLDAALNVPNATTREAMEDAVTRLRPTSAGPDQPDGSLRELCDLAYDHLLSAGYPEDGPVLTRIATGCTPDQQSVACVHDWQPYAVRYGTIMEVACSKCSATRPTLSAADPKDVLR
jgi:hypothetical protein